MKDYMSKKLFSVLMLLGCFLSADNAYAMHISEGILPWNWAAVWFVVAMPFVGYGLYRLKKMSEADLSFKPLVGLMAAVVFIISCMPIPVPTAGTCAHPTGIGIPAILLGPAISAVIAAAALLIQALFLSHGGLSTAILGINRDVLERSARALLEKETLDEAAIRSLTADLRRE